MAGLNDPIADLLTRIRNATVERHKYVDVHFSKQKRELLKVLQEAGFIENVMIDETRRVIRVLLKYTKNRESILNGLKRISSPGGRKYVGCKDIPKILGGLGMAILSTPKGILSGEKARQAQVGGELICYVW